MTTTLLILTVALAILGWGFYRARPFGQIGILAWLQSVVLMAPWLLFFGLFALGIYLNLAGVLFLNLASIALYVFLGNRLRTLGAARPSVRSASVSSELSKTSSDPALSTSDPASDAAKAQDPSEVSNLKIPASAALLRPTEATKIPADDLQAIQTIFGIDTFFVTESIPYQDGAIFKGNLRGDVEATHTRLTANLQEKVGDRYRLFLVKGPDERPVVVTLPSANDPPVTTIAQWVLASVLAVVTLATCLESAGLLQNFDLFADLNRVSETLPLGLGIVLSLVAHDVGHRVLARRYAIRLSPPFFIPTLQIGSFGSIVRFESLLPNRNVLFDIAVAGPIAGGGVAFTMLLLGLLLSNQGSLFQIPSEFFQGSILVGTLARVVLGNTLQDSLVDVHPLVVMGWVGLVITAINLMPAGQLDGGRVVQAIYGRKIAGRTTVATLIVLGLASLVNPLALYWAVLILFLQRDLERPALNELSEPDDARAALGLLILFLMAAMLLPLTPGLAGRLGIGG